MKQTIQLKPGQSCQVNGTVTVLNCGTHEEGAGDEHRPHLTRKVSLVTIEVDGEAVVPSEIGEVPTSAETNTENEAGDSSAV